MRDLITGILASDALLFGVSLLIAASLFLIIHALMPSDRED